MVNTNMNPEKTTPTNDLYYALGEIKASVLGLTDYMRNQFHTLEEKIDNSTKRQEAIEGKFEEALKVTNKRIDSIEDKIKALSIKLSVAVAVGLGFWAIFGPAIQRVIGVIT